MQTESRKAAAGLGGGGCCRDKTLQTRADPPDASFLTVLEAGLPRSRFQPLWVNDENGGWEVASSYVHLLHASLTPPVSPAPGRGAMTCPSAAWLQKALFVWTNESGFHRVAWWVREREWWPSRIAGAGRGVARRGLWVAGWPTERLAPVGCCSDIGHQ